MNGKFRASLTHGLMAYLLSLGMTLTALGVTGLLQHGWMAAMLLLVLSGGCVLAGMNRKAGLAAVSVAGFAGVVWLLIGGIGAVTEVIRALSLHMTGLKTALPMVGADFTVMVSVLCLAASWFVTQRSAGGLSGADLAGDDRGPFVAGGHGARAALPAACCGGLRDAAAARGR